MNPIHLVSLFFGGMFLANAIPHLTAGLRGKPFQSPFATPRGVGLSSSLVNVVWGWVNIAISYLLLCKATLFEIRDPIDAVTAAIGGIVISIYLAIHFGKINGGNI